jgi:uncharacterized membrane protein
MIADFSTSFFVFSSTISATFLAIWVTFLGTFAAVVPVFFVLFLFAFLSFGHDKSSTEFVGSCKIKFMKERLCHCKNWQ